jgi:hypothetical protein
VDSESNDIVVNRRDRRITDSSVGSPSTTLNFDGTCPFRSKRGDACVSVPVFWADVILATGQPTSSRGDDIIAAAYSAADKRWWLCASDYNATSSSGAAFWVGR